MVKSLLPDAGLHLLEELILPLNDHPPDRPFARLIARQTGLKRHIEKKNHARHPVSARQIEQTFASWLGERRGIHHTQAVDAQPLFNNKVEKREGLRLEPLVSLVITHERPGPVGRDNLSRPKVARRECRFPASHWPTENHHGGADQANRFFGTCPLT